MSKGPGLWQRLVVQLLGKEQSFPLRECWRLVAPERGSWTRSEYSALCRAVHSLAKRGQCQLIRADDLEDGRRRQSKTDQPILFITQPGVTVRRWHRQRSTTRQYVTFVSFDGANAAEWYHDPTPNPDGSTWSRQSMTTSDGHTSDSPVGRGKEESWYARKRRKVLVRNEARAFLEFTVGVGMVDRRLEHVSAIWERQERREKLREAGASFTLPSGRVVNTKVTPAVGGQWEGRIPPRLAGLRTRALALAITLLGLRMGGFFTTTGPTVQQLEDLAGGTLRDSLRQLARSGHLFINDRNELFVVGGFLRGADPQWFNGQRAEVRLELIHPEAETGAELVAETTTSVSVESLRIGEGERTA
jgi:hypothetical protein